MQLIQFILLLDKVLIYLLRIALTCCNVLKMQNFLARILDSERMAPNNISIERCQKAGVKSCSTMTNAMTIKLESPKTRMDSTRKTEVQSWTLLGKAIRKEGEAAKQEGNIGSENILRHLLRLLGHSLLPVVSIVMV